MTQAEELSQKSQRIEELQQRADQLQQQLQRPQRTRPCTELDVQRMQQVGATIYTNIVMLILATAKYSRLIIFLDKWKISMKNVENIVKFLQ